MVYRFRDADHKPVKFDTDTAECLLDTKWEAGRDQTRWIEIYRTRKGAYIMVGRTLWQGESNTAHEIEECEVLRILALVEDKQRTDAGDTLLAEKDPSEEV